MKKIIIGIFGFAMIFSAQSASALVFWTGESNSLDSNFNYSNNCTISSFRAIDTNIEEGDYSTLQWDTNNCNRVTISALGEVSSDGSEKVYPSNDTVYTLTAQGNNGSSKTASLRIYVNESNHYNNNNCFIDYFNLNKGSITSGDSVTLTWGTSGCDDVSITNIGDVSYDGSRVVYPTNNTTYTINAYGRNNQSRSVHVNVNNYVPATPIYNTNVVTIVATNIGENTAQLNGLVTSSNYNNTNVYFEYGTTVGLGNKTTVRTTNGNANFSEVINGLTPNTIYFYQAVSSGSNGISRGAIDVFRTLGGSNPVNTTPTKPTKPVVTQGTTVDTSTSPIMLRIENKYKTIGVGDTVDYVVTYKNIGTTKLTKPMIQVILPSGITFVNASQGEYSETDRTVSAPLEDLNALDEGVIYLQGKVDSIDPNLAQIVTTTILIYTNENGAQENAMAYVLNTPKEGNLLGASAGLAGMPQLSLIEWLLLIIFILLLALLARSLFSKNKTSQASH